MTSIVWCIRLFEQQFNSFHDWLAFGGRQLAVNHYLGCSRSLLAQHNLHCLVLVVKQQHQHYYLFAIESDLHAFADIFLQSTNLCCVRSSSVNAAEVRILKYRGIYHARCTHYYLHTELGAADDCSWLCNMKTKFNVRYLLCYILK